MCEPSTPYKSINVLLFAVIYVILAEKYMWYERAKKHNLLNGKCLIIDRSCWRREGVLPAAPAALLRHRAAAPTAKHQAAAPAVIHLAALFGKCRGGIIPVNCCLLLVCCCEGRRKISSSNSRYIYRAYRSNGKY